MDLISADRMKNRTVNRLCGVLLVPVLFSLLSCSNKDRLPDWEEGCMDIHFINTGRGESVYFIFPDGTTLLMDTAGSLLKKHKHMPVDPKPSAELSSGKVISDYVRHFLPKNSEGRLDYLMITHFHGDHVGDYADSLPEHSSGMFRLTSFAEVGASIPVEKVLFRLVDSMRPSSVVETETDACRNTMAFLDWAHSEYGTEVETFMPGGCSQITLKHDSTAYPDFIFRNIASGGYVWTGEGDESFTMIPEKDEMMAAGGRNAFPPENILSCVFLVSYGDFDYFSGGDIQYKHRSDYPYFDIEEPISRVIKEVEVMKASHHCTSFANSDELLGVARPDVVLAHVWRDVQPNGATLGRITASNPDCDIFLTNLAEKNLPDVAPYMDNIRSTQGHFVVRVASGGTQYMIYRLDDTDQEYRVAETFGPYECK